MSNFHDDMMASLLKRVNYLERRISNIEVFDNSFGLPSNLTYYTGTPTASTFAVWTGAGTLSGTALNTSSFVISQGVLGGQQVAGDTAISGSLHIYGTHYSAGTGNPALTAIYFAPSRGLTPSLSTRMDHDGDWTFTRNVAVQGTLNVEDVTGPAWDHGGLPGLSDDDHTQYFLLTGRGGGQQVYAGTGAADSLSFFASSGNSGDGAGIAFDFWAGTDPSDAHLLEMLHNGNARFFNPVGINVAPSTDAQLDVVSGAAGRHALRLKAAASPTVPVLEIEDSTSAQVFDVDGSGNVSADGYIRSNFGGFRSQQLPAVNNGQTLTVTITTNSANNNWQHLTTVLVTMGVTHSATARALYVVDVAWSIGTIGNNATVRATNVRINDTSSVTITGATAITNGFRLQFAATANFSAARNYLLVEDSHINNITIGTSVA